MKLHSLRIQGLGRHIDTTVEFSDATFLIGQNNVGKSTIFKALEYLLGNKKVVDKEDYYKDINGMVCNEIILTAEFRNLPNDSKNWIGFKDRVLKYEKTVNETGNSIVYKKEFKQGEDCKIYMKKYKRNLKSKFENCINLQDYIDNGIDEYIINENFPKKNKTSKLTENENKKLKNLEALIDDLFDLDENEIEWFENPGGISPNVLSKLPKLLIIPASDKQEELNSQKGSLHNILNELFTDVRESSQNYKNAQVYLEKLAKELDPNIKGTSFSNMLEEFNDILGGVFPGGFISVKAMLDDGDKSIKPQFDISIKSNVSTPITNQGTGIIRSAVFALLRYKTQKDLSKKQDENKRTLIIGFEEPEIYLHPNAVEQMKSTIYDLAKSDNTQIICTTHSPYMIDIGNKDSNQILNRLSIGRVQHTLDCVNINTLNTTNGFKKLVENERDYVKMVLKVDDTISRVFFCERTIIVEGDTEELVLKETIKRIPEDVRIKIESNTQIVRARGKASIISLVKYLKSMGVNIIVIHDKDTGKEGAEKFNKPILDAVGDEKKVFVLENCIEDILGYNAPSSEKPYNAYKYIKENWGNDWGSITSNNWKEVIENIFSDEFGLLHSISSN